MSNRNAATVDKWWERGLCREVGADLFFPDKGEPVKEAKFVCRGCEVKDECLQDALDRNEKFGVWGGLTTVERKLLLRQNQRDAA